MAPFDSPDLRGVKFKCGSLVVFREALIVVRRGV